jgi:hypothetical protein
MKKEGAGANPHGSARTGGRADVTIGFWFTISNN